MSYVSNLREREKERGGEREEMYPLNIKMRLVWKYKEGQKLAKKTLSIWKLVQLYL